MASITKITTQVSKNVTVLTKLVNNLSLSLSPSTPATIGSSPRQLVRYGSCLAKWQGTVFSRLHRCTSSLHTTAFCNDLMEFFDSKENWGKDIIKVGRSWKLDELRIKSNEDLHKLWFVLLKERNMLLTMEHACNKAYEVFPNPERLDKVRDSMDNLEKVVRERNRAYHLLETGETGERPGMVTYNPLGLKYYYRKKQHAIPLFMNKRWRATHEFGFKGSAVRKFLRLYREKLWNIKRRKRNLEARKVMKILRWYPNVDLEALKDKYPGVDIEACKRNKKSQGHYAP